MRNRHQRFSSEDVIKIRKLTDEGKSLNYLSKIMGSGKSAIYYQVRKFKPRMKKEIIVNLTEFQIGELIGAFAGDGNYFHEKYDSLHHKKGGRHRIRYSLTFSKERDYAEYLASLLTKLNLNPQIYGSGDSVLILVVNSKEYINFIREYLAWGDDKTYTLGLKKDISEYSDNFLRGFARGLMDTDGFLNSGNAACACISIKLMDHLSAIFERFGLEITRRTLDRGGNTRPLHYVRVRTSSLGRYREQIGFSNTHKLISLNKLLKKED